MRVLVAVLALVLAGCASHQQYGAFAEAPAGHRDVMAIDAVNQMAYLYPPASTRLSMVLEPTDSFGQALVDRLRLMGYAVQEAPAGDAGSADKPMGYVLDTLGDSTYRLMITVGSSSLSRAYMKDGQKFTPSGLWARKED